MNHKHFKYVRISHQEKIISLAQTVKTMVTHMDLKVFGYNYLQRPASQKRLTVM